jgi:hypothetical protein
MPKTGRWTGGTNGPSAAPREIDFLSAAQQLVGPDADLTVGGDFTVRGVPAFTSSPQVPNPVSPTSTTGAVSHGEVSTLIAAEPTLSGADTLHLGSMGAKGVFVPVANTSSETTLLSAVFAMPALPTGSTFHVVIGGSIKNTVGAVTYTFRLKSGSTVIVAPAVVTANDADAARGFRFVIDGETVGANTMTAIGQVTVAKGATDVALHDVAEAFVSAGGAGANWDLTVQMTTANANVTTTAMTATMIYTVP